MRDLIEPSLLPGLDFMPALDLTAESLPAIREGMEQMTALAPEPQDSGVEWREDRITAPDGHELVVRIYRPSTSSGALPAVLHIHGGGYVVGSVRTNHLSNIELAAATSALILSVDYRLAPETVAPGAVEDCYAALQCLHDNAGTLGVDAARIAVRGESAGGGLAAALALLARDRGGPSIAHQNLIYPMLDDRTCITRLPAHLGAFVWTPQANAFGWRALLGQEPGSANVSPYAAPARADDVSRLPAAFIAVGALDLFLVEDMDYARRLIEAGVATELHVYPGAYHGFDVLPDAAPVRQMKRDAVAALRKALHPVG
ncbi:putative esterase/lipase [Sphingobium herbicidovorans NBRC 16415]|uniref:Esterase/lipase n=1 Tax=Sphingobium herbicidovorans (strain ATCC 700291 / DSM 11019 / CCUG 56400 / KCTC 2939 / LMG 18315 / NBRC 16415 / MH) TaxID=1219045 RepID=A0A086PC35_SPHHM|nr:alpha/beta hydrolase [Sphingobium herbicidovorans]KFG90953.1 putative esterase/lipase [Sphingobium herbicidovorans NBRC 16415]